MSKCMTAVYRWCLQHYVGTLIAIAVAGGLGTIIALIFELTMMVESTSKQKTTKVIITNATDHMETELLLPMSSDGSSTKTLYFLGIIALGHQTFLVFSIFLLCGVKRYASDPTVIKAYFWMAIVHIVFVITAILAALHLQSFLIALMLTCMFFFFCCCLVPLTMFYTDVTTRQIYLLGLEDRQRPRNDGHDNAPTEKDAQIPPQNTPSRRSIVTRTSLPPVPATKMPAAHVL